MAGEDVTRSFVGIMAKAPRAGHAKTRLTGALPPAIAADLYRHFLLDTVDIVRSLAHVAAALICPPGDRCELDELGLGLPVVEQPEPGLMYGLAHGVEYALQRGHRAAALINADSPTLPAALIGEAIAALDAYDVVLGPTADGGYYLIGATVSCRDLLCGVPYPRSATIRDDTLQRARELGLRAGLAAPWFDIDLPDELRQLAASLRHAPPGVAAHTRRALQLHADALARLDDA